jgi:hypothetical protein
MTTTRSARSAVESRCAIVTTVRPAATAASARSTAASVAGSRGRGRLVENDNGGIRERHTGDTDELALFGREPHPPRLDIGLQAVRQRLEPLARADPVERSGNVLVRSLRLGEPDVVRDRPAEQVALLGQHHDPAMQ